MNDITAYVDDLATSRTLGDFSQKRFKRIIADPDFKIFDLSNKKPQFLIFASDGLWDVFDNNSAVNFVLEKRRENLQNIGEHIVEEARRLGSTDNITVIIIDLSDTKW